jgi:hypothetical protein
MMIYDSKTGGVVVSIIYVERWFLSAHPKWMGAEVVVGQCDCKVDDGGELFDLASEDGVDRLQ